eukprot:scaffold3717_cov124-Isochrysis_galbana.AAC.1
MPWPHLVSPFRRHRSFAARCLSLRRMSDAIASPAPLGPVTEESTPAPSVGAGPWPSVGRSYDDVSYTHYPSH